MRLHFMWIRLLKVLAGGLIAGALDILYAIGFGPLIGRLILLLTTIGRKSGRKRVTPLQYEKIGDDYYVGAARGLKADWVCNLRSDPYIEVRVGAKYFQGVAEVIAAPSRFADFMELRLERHPRVMGLLMERAHGLPRRPSRAQLEELGKSEVFVILHPKGIWQEG